jgi:hypothetical protein
MKPEEEIRTDPRERPDAPRESAAGIVLLLAALVIVGVVAAWVWRSQRSPPAESPVVLAPAPAPEAQPAASAPAPAVKHPLEEAVDQPLHSEDVPAALADLVGAKAVTSFLQTEGFARRVVATVDSLGRAHSPSAAWPVLPTGGRFTVEERPDGPVIAAENASRYTPFVLLVGTLDVEKAARLYRRMYPLLQQAYRQLGFGDRYLNDRVVEVIELLLATPEPELSPRLQLTEVKGPVPSTRPWVRYQFADPELESLAAGQKILLRVGPVNERRLKAKLAELRAQIVAAGSLSAASASPPASEPASAAASAPAATSAPRPAR